MSETKQNSQYNRNCSGRFPTPETVSMVRAKGCELNRLTPSGHYLSKEELDDITRPPSHVIDPVLAWLKSVDLKSVCNYPLWIAYRTSYV